MDLGQHGLIAHECTMSLSGRNSSGWRTIFRSVASFLSLTNGACHEPHVVVAGNLHEGAGPCVHRLRHELRLCRSLHQSQSRRESAALLRPTRSRHILLMIVNVHCILSNTMNSSGLLLTQRIIICCNIYTYLQPQLYLSWP